MRSKRKRLYGHSFLKVDRTIKNANKSNAARRRKRDGTGKFNYENESYDSCSYGSTLFKVEKTNGKRAPLATTLDLEATLKESSNARFEVTLSPMERHQKYFNFDGKRGSSSSERLLNVNCLESGTLAA